MKKVIITLIVDGALMSCWYLGKIEGIEGALNIAMFYMWACAVIGILISAIKAEDMWSGEQSINPLSQAADVIFITIAAYYCYYWLAALYAIASIIILGKKAEYINSYKENNNG